MVKMDLKKVFVIGTAGFVVVSLGLFYVLTNSTRITSGRSQREVNLENMERKLQSLEEAFQSHKMSMKELEKLAMSQQQQPKDGDHPIVESPLDNNNIDENDIAPVAPVAKNNNDVVKINNNAASAVELGTCSASVGLKNRAASDINMLDVYDLLKFDNQDGGVWKQGFKIDPDSSRFTESNKLKVVVIPHSHNDPGWIKTFEKYFEDQTKHILDNMLVELGANSDLKFIWAEISYFNLWWKDLSTTQKKAVQKLVENKQLEFVTGGWVMPDEANSHYYSILTQLTEGHQWLKAHLNVTPKNGWAIDPFGMSPTMAYILRRSGLANMLIQRTHYAVKKHLANLQQLEFRWRQEWDDTDSTDILCHMMPFYSYDVPHTCGPDPKICCQFDFKRMRGVSTMTCPWNVPPQPIVTQNLRERSLTLLDQYKKKAMLFRSNVLLIPLGDDFRWEDKPEWDAQRINYAKIFDYINSNKELNTEIGFGTLDDYFVALGGEMTSGRFIPNVLSGDFFTYADRDDHYWSGYFTSRPFHKAMDRELMGHLRAAQILFTTMTAELSKKKGGNLEGNAFLRGLLGKLINARRALSLFQHHDGVTGTSKDHVMVDYAQKLHTGLNACNHVMQKSLEVLTHLMDESLNLEALEVGEEHQFEPAFSKDHHHALPHHSIIVLDGEVTDRLVTVHNPGAHARTMMVTLYVSTYYVKVVDIEGELIESEVLPVFEDRTTLSSNTFQLNFVTELEPMAVKNFILKHDPTAVVDPPEITVFNSPSEIFDHDKFKIQSVYANTDPIFISNDHLTINFGETGFAKSVILNEKEIPWEVAFYKYGVRKGGETSGLYLFIPDGPATPLEVGSKPFIKVVKGRFLSYVEVWTQQVKHRVELYNHPGFERHSIRLTNTIDIRTESNFELVMRLKTSIASASTSHTDLNGFQMVRRARLGKKLPLQANIYPLPAATYIEDSSLRMTLLTRQPAGTGSLADGEVEVILDRRLMQDDNRGVAQGAKDNLETVTAYNVLFEEVRCHDGDGDKKAGMLSLAGHASLHDLLNPFRTFVKPGVVTVEALSKVGDYSPRGKMGSLDDLGCDIELVDMTSLPVYRDGLDDSSYDVGTEAGVTLRRVGFDGRFFNGGIPMGRCSVAEDRLGRFQLKELVGDLFAPKLTQMTLSYTHEGKTLTSDEPILMKPMEIYAFRTYFKK